jgi:hypothetical protein
MKWLVSSTPLHKGVATPPSYMTSPPPGADMYTIVAAECISANVLMTIEMAGVQPSYSQITTVSSFGHFLPVACS